MAQPYARSASFRNRPVATYALLLGCLSVLQGCFDTRDEAPDVVDKSVLTSDVSTVGEGGKAVEHNLVPAREKLIAAIEAGDVVDVAAVDADVERIREDLLIDRWHEALYRNAIGEVDIEEYYREHANSFTRGSVSLSHLLFRLPANASDEEHAVVMTRAQEGRSRLKAGESFDVVAAELSEDDTTRHAGGRLGRVAEGEIDVALFSEASALEAGDISQPIQTDYGIHILRVDETLEQTVRPLAEVRARIVKLLRAEIKRDALAQIAQLD